MKARKTEDMKFEMGKPNLEVFANALAELAGKTRAVVAVTSDSRGSGKLVSFGEKFPDQLIEVGIAEQNLVGISAGLASTGKKVFAVSPGSFLTARALEQIKNDVCYSNNPVNLIGISAGVSYGALGSTHHSIHDIAVLRAINNIVIIIPADNLEARWAVNTAAEIAKPVYIRFGKKPLFHLHSPDARLELGKAATVREGNDVAFIATGETVWRALKAAEKLGREGISCRVLSMHTVKPLDIEAVIKAGKECNGMVTVEEHRISGGLGEACAAALMQAGVNVPFTIMGIPDEYTVSGSQEEILEHYGLGPVGISKKAKELIQG